MGNFVFGFVVALFLVSINEISVKKIDDANQETKYVVIKESQLKEWHENK